ncbi:hypothetical protein MLD38_012139 [Melastoma candidum]|nr:hypothetical protein MLD38_012139 [Melastoma candidum]
MVSLQDSVYIIGGRRCYKEMAHVSDELAELIDVEIEVVSTVMRYDVRTGSWSECAQLGTPRSDFACTVHGNRIYVAGGQSAPSSARGVSSAEVYDPNLDVWAPLPDMGTLRYKCAGVTWNDRIYVVGGFVEKLDSPASPYTIERSSAEVFDPETGRWEMLANMWRLDIPPNQIVSLGGRLFSSGDCLKSWKGQIEAYDPKLQMWTDVRGSHLHRLSCPTTTNTSNNVGNSSRAWASSQQLYLTMAPIESHLYFLAGYRGAEEGEAPRTASMVHVFDMSGNSPTWRSMEPAEEEGEKQLCAHCCVVRLLA